MNHPTCFTHFETFHISEMKPNYLRTQSLQVNLMAPPFHNPLCYSGSALRDQVTKAILSLQEDDSLLQLKKKWWKTSNCQSSTNQKEDVSELVSRLLAASF